MGNSDSRKKSISSDDSGSDSSSKYEEISEQIRKQKIARTMSCHLNDKIKIEEYYHNVRHIIANRLYMLTRNMNIKILYAGIMGSRSQNLSSSDSDSDFDVRFIYVHTNIEHYIKQQGKKKENIKHEEFDKDVLKKEIEFYGIPLSEAIDCIRRCDPNVLEWVHCPAHLVIADYNSFMEKCKDVMKRQHKPISLIHCYSKIVEDNYKNFVQNQEKVITKKYVHAVRALLMVKYIIKYYDVENNSGMIDSNQPLVIMNFYTLLRDIIPETFDHVVESDKMTPLRAIEFVIMKKKGQVKTIYKIKVLNKWLEEGIELCDKYKKEHAKKKKKDHMKFTGRSITSCYKALQQESKKINCICRVNTMVNINNYKVLVSSLLKYLWVKTNRDKNYKELPKNFNDLLDSVKPYLYGRFDNDNSDNKYHNNYPHVKFMMDIINFKPNPTDIPAIMNTTCEYVDNKLLKHVLEFGDEINKINHPNTESKQNKNSRKEIRKDIYDYVCRCAAYINYLVDNPKASINTDPKNIFQVKQFKETKFAGSVSNILRNLKSVDSVEINSEFNEWIEQMVKKESEHVVRYEERVARMKEENRLEKLKGSVNKLSNEEFDAFIDGVLRF